MLKDSIGTSFSIAALVLIVGTTLLLATRLEADYSHYNEFTLKAHSQVDASHGQLDGGLESHQVKRRRCNSQFLSMLLFHGSTVINLDIEFAKIALKFYEKRQDAKFEILQVLFSNRALLSVPGFESVGPWCHVSFIAKPKDSDCCGKHFLVKWRSAMLQRNIMRLSVPYLIPMILGTKRNGCLPRAAGTWMLQESQSVAWAAPSAS